MQPCSRIFLYSQSLTASILIVFHGETILDPDPVGSDMLTRIRISVCTGNCFLILISSLVIILILGPVYTSFNTLKGQSHEVG